MLAFCSSSLVAKLAKGIPINRSEKNMLAATTAAIVVALCKLLHANTITIFFGGTTAAAVRSHGNRYTNFSNELTIKSFELTEQRLMCFSCVSPVLTS